MNKTLLFMNLFFLRKKYLKYLSIILLSPMIMYAINGLIVSDYLRDDSIKSWSSIGIWISAPILCSYICAYDIFSSIIGLNKKANFIFNSYTSTVSILLSIVIVSLFITLISFLSSYFIIYGLIGVSISGSDFIYLLISVFSLTLFFISIGLLLALYDRNNIGLAVVMLICCSAVQFSHSLHSKLEYMYNPIFDIISNCSSFILKSSEYVFSFKPILIMYLIALIFLAMIIYTLAKLIDKRYER